MNLAGLLASKVSEGTRVAGVGSAIGSRTRILLARYYEKQHYDAESNCYALIKTLHANSSSETLPSQSNF
jgi:histidyl-tRNA synthetase